MSSKSLKYRREDRAFQIILSSPLKERGFVPESGTEVFVKDVSTEVDENQLLEIFQTAGEIHQLRLLVDPETKRNRGLAYIQYTNKKAADAAVHLLHGRNIAGSRLHVEISFNNCRIFLGGIPVNRSKDEVWRELSRHRIDNIVDVIMYRSYNSRVQNRGFVFLEFKTHEEAAHFRVKHARIELFGSKLIVDWAIPMPEIDVFTMQSVKKIYLRNLDVVETPSDLKKIIFKYIEPERIEKVYKFKNYAFIHVATRREAEGLLDRLIEHYKDTQVEVTWSKPPNRYTKKEYRQKKLGELSNKLPAATSPSTSRQTPSQCSTASSQSSTAKPCKIIEPLLEDFSNLVAFDEIQPYYNEQEIAQMAAADSSIREQVEELNRLDSQQIQRLAFSGRLLTGLDSSSSGTSDELSGFDLQKMIQEFMDI